jgi:phenylalanyl-tRNA synthetase alpha chain
MVPPHDPSESPAKPPAQSPAELETLRDEVLAQLDAIDSAAELEALRAEVLGKKGRLKAAQKRLFDKAADKDAKKAVGQAFNPVQEALKEAFEAHKLRLGNAAATAKRADVYDVTRPGRSAARGTLHPLTQTVRDVVAIFRSMGFAIEDGPEIEDEFHSFDALNIPPGHLARDPKDNFVIGDTGYFRSQTSTVQIRVMERQAPPIRCIVPGKVYRPDTVDATHHFMFHQIEGLVVAEGITFADLKFVLSEFLHAYYAGQEFEWRLRPHFFPFTEASAEVDVRLAGSSKWLEMLGCGMVDPNVFEQVGIDAERYTGFAFGMGVERLAMLKHEIPVFATEPGEDVRGIRHFFDNDVRFLRQF